MLSIITCLTHSYKSGHQNKAAIMGQSVDKYVSLLCARFGTHAIVSLCVCVCVSSVCVACDTVSACVCVESKLLLGL